MKKLLKIITGVTLSLAMAIGVSIGVASNNKKAEPVYATDYTYSFTIDKDDFNTTSYAANNNEKHTTAVCTTDNNRTMEVYWTSYQVYQSGGAMQWKKSQGYIYNSTNLGTINSVTIDSSAGSFTTYYGTTEQPSSGTAGSGKGFFKTSVGGATGTTSSIIVNFTISESGGGNTPTTYSVTYHDTNATSGTVPTDNLAYETNGTITVAGNTGSLARTGYIWSGWSLNEDGSGTAYGPNYTTTYTVSSSNVNFYPKWVESVVSGTFNKWTSSLVPGDYILTYGSIAMGNTISSSKIQNSSLTFNSGDASISNPVASAVWSLNSFEENSTTYWSIYNSTIDKYLKWNSGTNLSLVDEIETNAKWTLVTDGATKDFQVNGDTRRLRAYNNVWSSYASSNGGALTVYKKHITATGISLNETVLELSAGEITTLTATPTPNGATATISWATSNSSIATVDAGVVTAVSAGSATITAFIDANSNSTFDPGEINATCSLTVTAGTPATDIELDETSINLLTGQQATLTATVTPNNATDAVVWSSSDETIATVSDGVVTTLKNGNVSITATAGSVHADCTISIASATASENFIGAKIDRNGILIAKSGKNAIIDDGQGGIWAFAGSNVSQSIGAVVNVKGTSEVYSGGLEVNGATISSSSGSITESEATPLAESAAKDYLDAYLAQPADPNFFMPTKKVSLRTGVVSDELGSSYLTWEYGETFMETNYLTGNMEAGKKYDIEGYIFKFYSPNNSDRTYIVIAVTQASEVEIHATSVSLNNDSLTIVEGNSETLTATLSPAGSVETVKWASSDENVATVDAGVVSAVSAGSATITAYIDADDDNVVDLGELKAECDITVIEPPAYLHTKVAGYDFSSNDTPSTTEYSKADLLTRFNESDETGAGLSDIVTNVTAASKVYRGQTDYCNFGLKFGTSSINGTFTLSLNTQVKRIIVKTVSWTSSDTLAVGDADVQTPGTVYTEENPITTLVFDITESDSITFTYSTRGFIQTIDFYTGVETDDPQDFIDTASLVQTIHGHENYTNQVLSSVDSVAIRFGATISKYNWQDMKSKWGITDYGVMLMKKTDLDESPYLSIEDAFDNNASSTILKNVNKRAGGAAYADPYLDGDNYLFTVKVSFPNDSQYYDDVIYAAPYVVVNGQYYFLTETHKSVEELAVDYYDTGYEYLSDAALTVLAGY